MSDEQTCAPLPAAVPAPAPGFQIWPFIQAVATVLLLALAGYIGLTGPVEQAKMTTKLDAIAVQLNAIERATIAEAVRLNEHVQKGAHIVADSDINEIKRRINEINGQMRRMEEHFWAKHWKGSGPKTRPPQYPRSPD